MTVRLLKVPVLFVMLGFVPLIDSAPTVTPVCKSTVALVIVKELLVGPSVPEPLTAKTPALTVVPPLYVFAPVSVSVPAPALMRFTPVPAITPLMVPAPLFVIVRVPLVAKDIAAALSAPVLTVNPVNPAVSPTEPVKFVVPPALFTVKPYAPSSVLAKPIVAELLVLLRTVLAPKVTAPV